MLHTSLRRPCITLSANRGGALAWTLVGIGALTLAAAIIWFLGDGLNRYRASQAMRVGRVALLASDLPTALRHLREAAIYRPTDDAIIQQYDQSQSRWVDMVAQKAATMDPVDASGELKAWAATETFLVEPHLGRLREHTGRIRASLRTKLETSLTTAQERSKTGRFEDALSALSTALAYRELSSDSSAKIDEARQSVLSTALLTVDELRGQERFAEARNTLETIREIGADQERYLSQFRMLDETEVRSALTAMTTALNEANLEAAQTLLERAEALQVLSEDVAQAKATFAQTVRHVIGGKLATALLANEELALRNALDQGKKFVGWAEISADSLLSPRDLPSFLEALDTIDLGPKSQSVYIDRVDIPIVAASRAKFAPAEVQNYLREAFLQWSRSSLQQGAPGFALFLDAEGRRYGLPADNVWRNEVIEKIIVENPITVTVADAKPDDTAPSGLNRGATNALRDALRARLTAWPKFVEFDVTTPATIVFSGAYAGLEKYHNDRDRTAKTVRYQSGIRKVPNPRINEIYDEFQDLRQRREYQIQSIEQKQAFVDRVNGNYNASAFEKSQATDRAIEIASTRALVNSMAADLERLRNQARSEPEYLEEPDYSNERYEVIKHVFNCILRWKIEATFGGEQQAQTVAWLAADTEFRTEEIAGNASRGVPVKPRQPLPEKKIAEDLTRPLIAKAANVDAIITELPMLTLRAIDASLQQQRNEVTGLDRMLGIIYAWESRGTSPSVKTQYQDYVRGLLGLSN
jgi:hypothetical protein